MTFSQTVFEYINSLNCYTFLEYLWDTRYIKSQNPTYFIDFGEFKMYSSFTGEKKLYIVDY